VRADSVDCRARRGTNIERERILNLQLITAVALGGAVGSVGRYLAGIGAGKIFGLNYPWGTLIINIVGSFLIGVFVELFALRWDLPQAMRVFLTVGICGGFTTFSTFSLESYLMIDRGEFGPAAAYIVTSVAVSIVALFGGLQLVRAVA
jgi:CrcB protein